MLSQELGDLEGIDNKPLVADLVGDIDVKEGSDEDEPIQSFVVDDDVLDEVGQHDSLENGERPPVESIMRSGIIGRGDDDDEEEEEG